MVSAQACLSSLWMPALFVIALSPLPAHSFGTPKYVFHPSLRVGSLRQVMGHRGRGSKNPWACSTDATAPFEQIADPKTLHRVFKERGWVHIPGFLREEACQAMLTEARNLLGSDQAFRSSEEHTVYQEEEDTMFSAAHPRNSPQKSSKQIADFDRLQPSSPLKHLYNHPSLLSLVQEIVSPDEELFLSACPYNSAYYNLYAEGDGLGWHFDKGEFGVNLVLQNPQQGGTFEYHPNTRSESDMWAFDDVSRILKGDMEGVDVATDAKAGSLIIFAGKMSLHRVSPVQGATPRINAILHYEQLPGQRLGAYSLKRFFGRE